MLIEQKKEYLQDIVKNAFTILSEYAESSAEPDPETIIRLLSRPRYDVDQSAYFFAYQINTDGTYSFAFHATKPQLNGKKTNIDNPDVNGVKFRRLLIEGSQKGENFVEYTYAKGKQDNLQPKLSYSLHLKKWNWVLVGGIYLDNVAAAKAELEQRLNRELRTVLITITVISLVVMLLTILGTLYFGNRIARPITDITGIIAKIADGRTDISVQQDQTAEIGAMQQSLQKLLDSFIKKSQFANAVAAGDLSQQIEASSGDDSLGKALIIMQENLKQLIDDINIIAGGVVSGAKEVMDASTTLSQGATEQAASAEQINSSLVVIKDETDRNADDARKAEGEATETREATNSGVISINQLNDAMQTIINSSQEIFKVIKTIDEIAFQTNLLALNAAIEAARAGKFGKSFKVVADEVRSLANKSAIAAKETTELIEGAIGSVSKGEGVVETTREMLIEVTERINNLTNLTDSIARSSMDQAKGITEVTGGVDQISKVTQSNAAQSEETASSAQELHSLATKLKSAVEHFTLE
ncbi:MAG: methyl-accepting chemotaxis protein [Proteobacteria bacterium]|nr:methyl-accepting chemotaxis protein [Pseudomonadota bacterium]